MVKRVKAKSWHSIHKPIHRCLKSKKGENHWSALLVKIVFKGALKLIPANHLPLETAKLEPSFTAVVHAKHRSFDPRSSLFLASPPCSVFGTHPCSTGCIALILQLPVPDFQPFCRVFLSPANNWSQTQKEKQVVCAVFPRRASLKEQEAQCAACAR